MRHKILKAYRSNPILSIHVFAVVYFFVIYAALEILHIICKRELTYIALKIYAFANYIAGSVCLLTSLITLVGVLTGSVIL